MSKCSVVEQTLSELKKMTSFGKRGGPARFYSCIFEYSFIQFPTVNTLQQEQLYMKYNNERQANEAGETSMSH